MKRLTLIILIVVMSLSAVGLAAAQDPDEAPPATEENVEEGKRGNRGDRDGRRDGRRGNRVSFLEVTAATLEVDEDVLREALQADDETTLADVIEANGGDVDDVVAAIIAEITANADGDDLPEDLEERVTERVTTPKPQRGERGEGNGNGQERSGYGAPDSAEEEAPAAEGEDL